MKKIVVGLALFFFLAPMVCAMDITLGVLAKRGKEVFYESWLLHGQYLCENTGDKWRLIPLAFEEIEPAVRDRRIDFLLTNPSMFVDLEGKYGLKPVATMTKASKFGEVTSQFGGVIFTHASSTGINSLADIRGRPFVAVKRNSLGGFQVAAGELMSAGVDVAADMASMEFAGTHDKVVKQVMARPGTVGTVRTDTLENMEFESAVNMNDVKVLGAKQYSGFPYVISTALYPEWPFAALPHVDEDTVDKAKLALLALDKDHYAAKLADIAGWVEPMDYSKVKNLRASIGVD